MRESKKLGPVLRFLKRIWDLLWIVRVPVSVSAVLTGVFLWEGQSRDALRVVLENVSDDTFGGAAWRVIVLLGTTVMGALALWFWSRQCLRKLASDEEIPPDEVGFKARTRSSLLVHLPRIGGVAPVFALSVTLARLRIDDPALQGARWVLAAAFFGTGLALYMAFHLRGKWQLLSWTRTEGAYQWMAWGGFGLALVVFIFSLWVREYAYHFGPVGVLWLGAAFWTTLLSPLAIIATRQGVPWLLLLGMLGFALGATNCTDNHRIRHARAPGDRLVETDPVTRISVVDGFRAWKKEHPDPNEPIIFVAAEGGGIYAAHHAAYLLARLHEETGGAFGRQVFLLSSVSGGSVGCGVFVSLLAAEKQAVPGRPAVGCTTATRTILEADLLSPLLLAAVGPDALQRFLPVGIPLLDRARALEDTLAYRWRAAEQAWVKPGDTGPRIDWSSDGSIWDLWLKPDGASLRADLPALFINTTVVESGTCATIGPYGVPVLGDPPPPALHHLWAAAPGLRIPIPAALALSARFPFVTPPGGLDRIQLRPVDFPLMPGAGQGKPWRFADGGYYDNTGIETVLAVLQVLAPERDGDEPLLPLENVRVLVIGAQDESVRPNGEGLADLLTPVRALLRVRENRSSLARINLLARIPRYQYCVSTLQTKSVSRLDPKGTGQKSAKPDIPLGWMLSANSAAQIRAQTDRDVDRLRHELLARHIRPEEQLPGVRLQQDARSK